MKTLFILTLLILNSNANIKVIATNSCNFKSLNSHQIKHLFLLNIKEVNTQKIVVFNRKSTQLIDSFSLDLLDKKPRQLKTYWTRMIFTGVKQAPANISNLNLKNRTMCYVSYEYTKRAIPKTWKRIVIND